jgi:hypothetical protein
VGQCIATTRLWLWIVFCTWCFWEGHFEQTHTVGVEVAATADRNTVCSCSSGTFMFGQMQCLTPSKAVPRAAATWTLQDHAVLV